MSELNGNQIINELEKFKRRILDNSKLAENVFGREMEAILNAIALIKELTVDTEHKCIKTDTKTVEKCKLNREQIIKALECCQTPLGIDCKDCGYSGKIFDDDVDFGCVYHLMVDALALIKELAEKNERLRAVPTMWLRL